MLTRLLRTRIGLRTCGSDAGPRVTADSPTLTGRLSANSDCGRDRTVAKRPRGWRRRDSDLNITPMPHQHSFRYIGHGLYSLSDAERLTRVPRLRIRRWMEGYTYLYGGGRKTSRPIIRSDISREAGELALTFADLMEVRFNAFRHHGVSWHSIRIAAHRVRNLIDSTHPFSNKKFKTDGKTILAEIAHPTHGEQLLDLVKNQWEISRMVRGMLFAGIEFNEFDEPRLWWPLKNRRIVIDPERAFGAPVALDGSVPTFVLAASAKAEGSQKAAAAIFEVPVRAVRDSVAFERQFAA